MAEYGEAQNVCPFCGYVNGTPAKEAYHLAPGSILNNRYVVGRALGYGGFGVTYIGYDAQLGRKVAIKEYMPGDFSMRMPGEEVMTVYKGDASEQFAAGLQSFLDEARRLAKFNALPGIVAIYDSFLNNSTGYLVMEYLEGMTAKEAIEKNGPFSFDEALEIILGVLRPLKEVHKAGIIHRDIAPDNIFLTVNGGVKLIDFGAARYATTLRSKSLSVILKPGYAPEEQYRSHGRQGPWSDIYAIAATFYKILTGVTPDEVMDRKMHDMLKEPSLLGAKLPKSAENAIMNALNINAEDRPQSAAEFEAALISSDVARNKVRLKKADSGRLPIWAKALSGVLALALTTVGALAATGAFSAEGEPLPWSPPPEGYVRAPGVIKFRLDEAQPAVEAVNLLFTITDKRFDDAVPADLVLLQDPKPGAETPIGSLFNVVVSGGEEKIPIKDVVDMYRDDATAELEALGFSVVFLEEYSTAAPGVILRQSPSPDTEAAPGSMLTLIVSKGSEEVTEEIRDLEVPHLIGLDFAEAKTMLGDLGISIVKSKDIYSVSVPKNRILSQSPKAGAIIHTGRIVSVTVSLGSEKTAPDVQYKTEAQALQMIAAAGFKAQTKYEESATVQKGNVIRQSVRAGSKATMDSVIVITVSSGKTVAVPNVVGMSGTVAQAALAGAGLQIQFVAEYSETVAKDTVISQSVEGGAVKAGDTVTIVVSLGKAPQSSETAKVPDVKGKSASDAQAALQEAGFFVRVSSEEFSDSVKAGNVISQDIRPGTTAKKKTTVAIIVSKGPANNLQSTVPDVVWNSTDMAKAALLSGGFLAGNVEQRYSDTFPAGYVISQNPGAGTTSKTGSKVNLVVSKGPEPSAPVALSAISVSQLPSKREYLLGESFATGGLVVMASYSNASSRNVTSTCNFSGFNSSTEGAKTIVVSYSENATTRTASFTVTVKKPTQPAPVALSAISVSQLPSKREYLLGESFATGGLVVMASYSDASSRNVTGACNFSGFNSSTEGAKTIVVSYSENAITRTTSFTVTVTRPPTPEPPTPDPPIMPDPPAPDPPAPDPTTPPITPAPPTPDLPALDPPRDWQPNPLPVIPGYRVEERKEYRHQDRETKNAASASMSGWTLYETKQAWGPWNGTWLSYDPGKSATRETMTRQAATYKTQIHYEHWRYWNTSYNAYYYKGNTNLPGVSFTYEELYADSPLRQYGNTSDGMAYWAGSGALWFNPRDVSVQSGTQTEWQYRDLSTTYCFERWGSWSNWIESDNPPSPTSERRVETRVMYRYAPI
jgi:beta-lactam-binding protein with PASTA domain